MCQLSQKLAGNENYINILLKNNYNFIELYTKQNRVFRKRTVEACSSTIETFLSSPLSGYLVVKEKLFIFFKKPTVESFGLVTI